VTPDLVYHLQYLLFHQYATENLVLQYELPIEVRDGFVSLYPSDLQNFDASFRPKLEKASGKTISIPNGHRFCSRCGAAIESSGRFCTKCGNAITISTH